MIKKHGIHWGAIRSQRSAPRILTLLKILLCSQLLIGQTTDDTSEDSKGLVNQLQLHVGRSNIPNTGFPDLRIQRGISLCIGQSQRSNSAAWAQILDNPKTGICIGITDFGNREYVGLAYSIMPFVETGLGFNKQSKWSTSLGLGASYFNKTFHSVSNANNRAISTRLNWTFRSFIYRRLFENFSLNWRLGLGFIHHSNGHTRLPNQGLNSFLLCLSAEFNQANIHTASTFNAKAHSSPYRQVGMRIGRGRNIFSLMDNDAQNVNTLTINYSKVYRDVFRVGLSAYCSQYEHYRHFILYDEALVPERYSSLRASPFSNSLAIGLAIESEFVMGHIGAQFDIGFNVFKPAYELDWKINEGHYDMYKDAFIYGELNSYYQLKKRVSSRLALNYYLVKVERRPMLNAFISAALNANLGQADFTELSIGLIRKLNRTP